MACDIMSTEATVLGIDVGTSSVKVILTNPTGKVLAQALADYPVNRLHPGWAGTDPQDWWRAVRTGVRQVLAACPAAMPSGIGLSGQMHGVVLCSVDGTPVRPAVLWADARAEAELDLIRSLPDAVRARLANPLSPGMAGPVLAWLHRHEPEVVSRARWALQPKDWIRARLTGEFAAEPSDASATLLYDAVDQRWHAEVVAAFGIRPQLLPDILPFAGVVAGHLQPTIATELALPPGIPVSAGAGDSAAAALGSGIIEPGTVQLTIGTGVQILTVAPAPTLESIRHRHNPVTHLYRSATRDGWYAMAAGLTGGQTLDWVRRLLRADWAELYATADRGPQQGDPIFLPHLVGERTPYLDTQLRGSWTGLNPRHDRTALLYTALEGVAFAVADGLDALPASPPGDRQLRLAGGGTTSPGWRALLADALNAHLHAVEIPGASARGAALLAAQAAALLTDTELLEVAKPHTALVASPGPGADALRTRRQLHHDTLHALRTLR